MVAGLDAIIIYSNNPDAPTSLKDTNVIPMLGKIFTQHNKVSQVVWRICYAITIFSNFSPDVAAEIARLELHEPLVACFRAFSSEPMVQQQILNVYAVLLGAGQKSRNAIHRSKHILDMLKEFITSKDEQIAAEQLEKRKQVIIIGLRISLCCEY